jgi:hypothetical protein
MYVFYTLNLLLKIYISLSIFANVFTYNVLVLFMVFIIIEQSTMGLYKINSAFTTLKQDLT